MIAENGGGKTSILDVFSLLAASASGALNKKISEMGGLEANLTEGLAPSVSFEIMESLKPQGAKKRRGNNHSYKLVLAPKGVGYEIREESLQRKTSFDSSDRKLIESRPGDIRFYKGDESDPVAPTWDYDFLESSLAQVPPMFEGSDFRKRLASSTHYHLLDIGPRAPIRSSQPLQPAMLPGTNGEDLVSCLLNLRETDRGRFEIIEDTLRAGFPDFERLDFPPVAAGMLAMTWKDRNFRRPFYMHQLSEGTLRFLWLVTSLLSAELTSITLIDEPEVSLHPALLALLADLLREASQRTQLVVATHSDRLIRFLEPKEVVALELADDGYVTAKWADQFDLEKWLEEYALDELWRMGRIGARP